jgi:hypothetical protein
LCRCIRCRRQFMCRRLTNANVPDEHSMCVCGGKRIIRAKGEIEGVGWKSNFLFVYSATS